MLMVEIIISAFLIFGASIALIGSFGMCRLPDIYSRLHGPTKASTLGVGSTLFGSFLVFSIYHDGISMQEALIIAFLFITAPVSANMLAKAALHRNLPWVQGTKKPPETVKRPAQQQSAEK